MLVASLPSVCSKLNTSGRSSPDSSMRTEQGTTNGNVANDKLVDVIITDVVRVISGDFIVTKEFGSTLETYIYLSYVSAPHVAKRPTKDGASTADEPFAWQAREFIRRKLVGKTIIFLKDFTDNSGRAHGRIFIPSKEDPGQIEDVTEAGVASGWLQVRVDKEKINYSPNFAYLSGLNDLQEAAIAHKKGRWGKASKAVRQITWNIVDPRALLNRYNKQPVKAVVEMVNSGGLFRAFLLPNFEYVSVLVAKIRVPFYDPSQGNKSEPFGIEAKEFLEKKILQRDVQIILESTASPNNTLFTGSVLISEGDIAEMLIEAGLAQTRGTMNKENENLFVAQEKAMMKKIGLWENYKE